MKFFFFLVLFATMASCTMITSKNLPGKSKSSFPKEMQGTYNFVYPETYASMMEGTQMEVVISESRLDMINTQGTSSMVLNDSIYLSTIKKDTYLSIGKAPALTVFKLVKVSTGYELYSMFTDGTASVEDLKPFFKDITAKQMDSEDESSDMVYEVTIDDKKLNKYFNSKYPSKEPFKLIRK